MFFLSVVFCESWRVQWVTITYLAYFSYHSNQSFTTRLGTTNNFQNCSKSGQNTAFPFADRYTYISEQNRIEQVQKQNKFMLVDEASRI